MDTAYDDVYGDPLQEKVKMAVKNQRVRYDTNKRRK